MMADLCARANRTDSLLLVLTLVALATGSFLCMASSASATAQDFVPLTTFNGVACASPNQCIGVGTAASGVKSGAAAPLNPVSGDLSTGQSFQLIGSSGLLNGVSCPSRSACLAVGENPNETRGIAVPLDPDTAMVRRGQELHIISGIFMSGVACASRKQCLAVGHDSSGSGVVVAIRPATGAISSGQRVQTIPGTGGVGLDGVACPSANLCVAVGENAEGRPGLPYRWIRPPGRYGVGGASKTSLTKASCLTWPVRRPQCAWRWVGVPANRRWLYRSTRERVLCQKAKAIDPYRRGRQC